MDCEILQINKYKTFNFVFFERHLLHKFSILSGCEIDDIFGMTGFIYRDLCGCSCGFKYLVITLDWQHFSWHVYHIFIHLTLKWKMNDQIQSLLIIQNE